MAKLPVWEWFMQAVEGRLGAPNVVISEGRLLFKKGAAPQGPRPALLAELLRGSEPLPQEVRAWIADLLDGDPSREVRLQFKRARRGAPDRGGMENWPAAKFALRLMEEENVERKRAIGQAQDKFKVSRSTVEAAMASLTAARLGAAEE